MTERIQQCRDAAANWTTANPTLAAGEVGVETDTGKAKVGDGTTAWTSLGYIDAGSVEHIADGTDANCASAISMLDAAGNDSATDVEGVLAEQVTKFASPSAERALTLFDRLADEGRDLTPGETTAPTDTPRISDGTAASVTGRIIPPHLGEVTEVGSRGTWDSVSARYSVSSVSGLDFYLHGDVVEIGINPMASRPQAIWVWVNGLPVSASPMSITMTTSSYHYVKLEFGSVARRRIEFFAPSINAWVQVATSAASTITPAPRRPVIAWVGDSIYSGSAGTAALQCPPFLISRALGTECFQQAFGGTGYIATGLFHTFGSSTRVDLVAASDPEIIVIAGSVNDDSSHAIVGAAATAAYTAYAAACPNAKLVVFGPSATNAIETVSSNRRSNNQAVRAAAVAAPNVIAFVDQIGNAAASETVWVAGSTYQQNDLVSHLGAVWKLIDGAAAGHHSSPGTSKHWGLMTFALYGTGQVGSTANDGPRDTLLHSDGIHPTTAGSGELAQRHATEILNALRIYSATAS